MPNCNTSIVNWQTEGRELTSLPIPVAFNLAKNDTLFFTLPNTQTVYFYFNLNLVSGIAPQVTISVYDSKDYKLVSSLTSTGNNITTNIDLPAGTYIVCLRSLKGNFEGTARADYYGFSRTVTFEPFAYESGQECIVELKLEPRPKPCNKPMHWDLIEGEMPPGLRLDASSGLIQGVLPWLDCLEDKESPFNDIPSANLFFKTAAEANQTVEPWGRRWDFKIRLYTIDQPENFDEKWYCVTIYNDWSRSTQKFFDNYKNENTLGTMIVPKPKPYYFGLCPPNMKEVEKSIDHTLDSLIVDWEGVTGDDNIIHIEIDFDNPNSALKDNNNNLNKINTENNLFTEFKRIYGKGTKQVKEIENDGITVYGVYNKHNTTLDIDRDIIDVNDIYIPPGQTGYINPSITLDIEGYEHFLTFRQWILALESKLLNSNTKETVQQYLQLDDSEYKLLQRYQNADSLVQAEYFEYFPDSGHEWSDEDTKGLSDNPKYFIHIFEDLPPDDLPEVKSLTNMIENQKEKGPWNVFPFQGETVLIELTV